MKNGWSLPWKKALIKKNGAEFFVTINFISDLCNGKIQRFNIIASK